MRFGDELPQRLSQGVPEPGDGCGDGSHGLGFQLGEDPSQEIVPEEVHLAQDPPAVVGELHEDHPAVAGDPAPPDEAAFCHTVDETGHVRQADVEELGEVGHRKATVAFEEGHGVEVAHAHTEPAQPFAPQALQFPERRSEVGEEGRQIGLPGRLCGGSGIGAIGRHRPGQRLDTPSGWPRFGGESVGRPSEIGAYRSCHVDHRTYTNHSVKPNHSSHLEDAVRIALMIEAQQGLHYEDLFALARTAEETGFETFFRSDHYLSFPGPAGRPATDAWTTLAGLARETRSIRLGVLVSPVTFRHPGTFAKIVATVDEMSGGRVEVGMGAGWNEAEHRAHGLPFPPIDERAAMLEEAIEIVRGLWTEPDGWSYAGRFWTVEDARFAPKPVQQPAPPIIVGGGGTPRGLRIAARHADELNCTSSGPERVGDRFAALDEACRAVGRDPSTIRRSAMVGVLVGRTEAEFEARRRALVAEVSPMANVDSWLAARAERWIVGDPQRARAMARRFADSGCERLMLQDFIPRDLDHVKVLADVLVGRV